MAAGSITRVTDDRRLTEQFIFFLGLSFILPPLFNWLSGYIGDIANAIVYLILALAMIPLLRPFSRVTAAAIIPSTRPAQPNVSMTNVHQEADSEIHVVVNNEP